MPPCHGYGSHAALLKAHHIYAAITISPGAWRHEAPCLFHAVVCRCFTAAISAVTGATTPRHRYHHQYHFIIATLRETCLQMVYTIIIDAVYY